jgi:hypothetical protein
LSEWFFSVTKTLHPDIMSGCFFMHFVL